MPSLFSIFHRKTPSQGQDEPAPKDKAEPPPKAAEAASQQSPQQEAPPMYTETSQPAARSAFQPTAPRYAPGTGPMAHAQMVQANNMGMLGGAIIGDMVGGSPVTGMMEGQVGANMIMQRVQQEQRHLYYREQALRYRDGLPADGVGAAGGLAPPLQAAGGRDRSRSRSQRRDERRRKRWERRAKRRDGGGGVENEISSGSESE